VLLRISWTGTGTGGVISATPLDFTYNPTQTDRHRQTQIDLIFLSAKGNSLGPVDAACFLPALQRDIYQKRRKEERKRGRKKKERNTHPPTCSIKLSFQLKMAASRAEQIAGHLNYPRGMLAGQLAIITGAGQGIGAETARLFANEGARVVVADVDAGEWIGWKRKTGETRWDEMR
jgi:hypothetical protein